MLKTPTTVAWHRVQRDWRNANLRCQSCSASRIVLSQFCRQSIQTMVFNGREVLTLASDRGSGSKARVKQTLFHHRATDARRGVGFVFTLWELPTDTDLKRLNRAASYTELLILVLIFLPVRSQQALLSIFNICPVTLPGAF